MPKKRQPKKRRDPADDGLKPSETPKEIMVVMTKDTYEFARRYAREGRCALIA